jgi:hypothetical protein
MYAIATLANKSALHDLNVILFSLQLWNSSLPNIYIYCDSFIESYLTTSKPYKGKVFIKNALNSYTNYNRSQMEKIKGKEFSTLFGDFVCEKMSLLNWVFTQEKEVLFCDADICFLGSLPTINTDKQLVLSKHEIRRSDEERFGIYNAGFLYLKDSSIPDKWKEFSKKSNFFEQLSLEDLTEVYTFETFSIQNNYGWWRLLQGKESEEVLKKKWSIKRTVNSSGVAVEGEPLLSVHTHWKTDDNATKYFNKFIKEYLQKLASVEKTSAFLNYLKKNESLKV